MQAIIMKILLFFGYLTAEYIFKKLYESLEKKLKNEKINVPSFIVESAITEYLQKLKKNNIEYGDVKAAIKNNSFDWVIDNIVKGNNSLEYIYNSTLNQRKKRSKIL